MKGRNDFKLFSPLSRNVLLYQDSVLQKQEGIQVSDAKESTGCSQPIWLFLAPISSFSINSWQWKSKDYLFREIFLAKHSQAAWEIPVDRGCLPRAAAPTSWVPSTHTELLVLQSHNMRLIIYQNRVQRICETFMAIPNIFRGTEFASSASHSHWHCTNTSFSFLQVWRHPTCHQSRFLEILGTKKEFYFCHEHTYSCSLYKIQTHLLLTFLPISYGRKASGSFKTH